MMHERVDYHVFASYMSRQILKEQEGRYRLEGSIFLGGKKFEGQVILDSGRGSI